MYLKGEKTYLFFQNQELVSLEGGPDGCLHASFQKNKQMSN